MHSEALTVSQDWDHKASWCSDCHRNIDEVPLNHVGSINHAVDYWVFLKGFDCSSNEERHESELDAILIDEFILVGLNKCQLTFLISIASPMSTSWKVVSKAYVF